MYPRGVMIDHRGVVIHHHTVMIHHHPRGVMIHHHNECLYRFFIAKSRAALLLTFYEDDVNDMTGLSPGWKEL
jgi:hypothetical protein